MLALEVPELHGGAGGAGEQPLAHADVDHPGRPVEEHSGDVGPAQQRHDLARGEDRPVGQLAHPLHRLGAGEHVQQHPGCRGVGRPGGGALSHLPQRVGPALLGGARQVRGGGCVAEAGSGLRPVRLEQRLLEAVELPGEDGAGDRVEEGVDHHHVVEGARAVHPPGLVRLGRVALDAVGVVALDPVADHPLEVAEGKRAGVLDQQRLLLGEGGGVRGVARGEEGDVVGLRAPARKAASVPGRSRTRRAPRTSPLARPRGSRQRQASQAAADRAPVGWNALDVSTPATAAV